jgi:dsDNA-binding SOS-regulon protein
MTATEPLRTTGEQHADKLQDEADHLRQLLKDANARIKEQAEQIEMLTAKEQAGSR